MKHPMLGFYQSIMILVGIAMVGGGIVLGITIAQQDPYQNFNIQTFATTAAVLAAPGMLFLVLAELISVFTNMEDRLDKLYELAKKQVKAELYAVENADSEALPLTDDELELEGEFGIKATVRAPAAAVIHKPSPFGKTVGSMEQGQTLQACMRTSDAKWVSPSAQGTKWIYVEDLHIEDDINSLPVWTGK